MTTVVHGSRRGAIRLMKTVLDAIEAAPVLLGFLAPLVLVVLFAAVACAVVIEGASNER